MLHLALSVSTNSVSCDGTFLTMHQIKYIHALQNRFIYNIIKYKDDILNKFVEDEWR